MRNIYLQWLAAIAVVLPSLAGVMWVIGAARESQGFGAGAGNFAVASWLLQWGVLALLLWLLGRGIVAHLAPIPGPTGTATSDDASGAPAIS